MYYTILDGCVCVCSESRILDRDLALNTTTKCLAASPWPTPPQAVKFKLLSVSYLGSISPTDKLTLLHIMKRSPMTILYAVQHAITLRCFIATSIFTRRSKSWLGLMDVHIMISTCYTCYSLACNDCVFWGVVVPGAFWPAEFLFLCVK